MSTGMEPRRSSTRWTSGRTTARVASMLLAAAQSPRACTVSWSDDTEIEDGTVNELIGSGTCGAKHTYAAPGKYSIKVTVTNSFGDSATVSVIIAVETLSK